jgi:hypothetical protein
MALKVEVDTLDGVEETLQPYYKQDEDGRYRLDIDGLPDVSGLKNALNDERNQRKDLSSKLKRYDGVDLDFYGKVASKRDLFEKFEKSGGVDEEAIKAQIESRTTRMREEHEREVQGLSEKLNSTSSRLSKLLVDNAVSEAALKSGVMDTALEDVLRRAKEVFRVVDGVVVPQNRDGDTIYGKDGVRPLTQDEWLSDLRNNAPHLFKPSKGGGAAPDGGKGGGATNIRARSDLSTAAEKAKYIGEHGMDKYLELPLERAG